MYKTEIKVNDKTIKIRFGEGLMFSNVLRMMVLSWVACRR